MKGCFCHFNGYEVKDAKARRDISTIQGNVSTIQNDVSDLDSRVDQIANNQIPDEYLQASVDNYMEENESGVATKTDLEELEGKLSGEIEEYDNHFKEWVTKALDYQDSAVFSSVTWDWFDIVQVKSAITEKGNIDKIKVTAKANGNTPPIVYFSGTPSKDTLIGFEKCGISGDSYVEITDYLITDIPQNCTHILFQSDCVSYSNYKFKVEDFKQDFNQCLPIKYHVSNGILTVETPFNDTTLKISFGKRGVNNLPDFRTIEVGSESIYANITDWHSPMVVGATTNIDGDQPDAQYFTGGNHSYNNTGEGVPSALCSYLKYFVDGKMENENSGYCNNITIEWENLVRGYNTEKADGSGREIIKEHHTIRFNGVEWESNVDLIPLEEVNMVSYFGFQCASTNNHFTNIRYIGAKNRGVFMGNTNNDCGDNTCNKILAYGDLIKLEMELDTSIDLGDRKYYTSNKACYNNSYGKAYFNLITNTVLNSGDMYSARLVYRFSPSN